MTRGPRSRPTGVEVVVVRGDEEVVRWAFTGRADLDFVDGLARAQRAARLAGLRIRLEDLDPELAGLLDLVGLRELF